MASPYSLHLSMFNRLIDISKRPHTVVDNAAGQVDDYVLPSTYSHVGVVSPAIDNPSKTTLRQSDVVVCIVTRQGEEMRLDRRCHVAAAALSFLMTGVAAVAAAQPSTEPAPLS